MSRNSFTKTTALAVATGLLTINFWSWSLISPLASAYGRSLSLSSMELSIIVAAPIIIGSLGRIPLGLLTDRYGGRRMFAFVCILAGLPVFGLAMTETYPSILVVAFCLGISGAAFAIGVPFINAWFPHSERGFALGVYALGNAGTAVSGLLTPRLVSLLGRSDYFIGIGMLLLLSGIAMALWGREAPGWRPATGPASKRFSAALRWEHTWKLALLYAITFGAFVAFGLYLPILLTGVYQLSLTDAAARAAGFVLLATLARLVGGWLSDRIGSVDVLRGVFITVAAMATYIAFSPSLSPLGTLAYLTIAVALGFGNGAVFGFIGHRCNPKYVGAVGGLVGMAGGLGGFFPPLLMGASKQFFHSYTAALLMLALISLTVFLNINKLFGSIGRKQAVISKVI